MSDKEGTAGPRCIPVSQPAQVYLLLVPLSHLYQCWYIMLSCTSETEIVTGLFGVIFETCLMCKVSLFAVTRELVGGLLTMPKMCPFNAPLMQRALLP